MKKHYFIRTAVLFGLMQLILIGVSAYAQNGFGAYDIATKVDNYYPPSVSASQLFRKPPEDIDFATGHATIRIPIYEIRTADFTLPISLYYITEGIKVNQLNGPVALGWQLDAEPMITRKTRGKPDEVSTLLQGSLIKEDSENYRRLVGKGETDPMQDIFYYRLLNGKVGKFILEDSYRKEFIPKLLNSDNIKISAPEINNKYNYPIHVTNTDGTKYIFGGDGSACENTLQPFNHISCITSWKVTSITSVNGDSLHFRYRSRPIDEYPYSYYDFYTLETYFGDDPAHGLEPTEPGKPPHPGYWKGVNGKMNYYYLKAGEFKKWRVVNDEPYRQPGSHVETRPIERIDFEGGCVRFFYDSPSSSLFLLKRVEIYSGTNCIRTVCLNSSAASNTRPDYYLLNSVEISGADNNIVERYSFKYHSGFDKTFRNAVDYWGYYNGESRNTDLVAKIKLKMYGEVSTTEKPVDLTIGGAENKENDYLYVSAFMLEEVTYPSGGCSQYNYESHDIYLPMTNEYGRNSVRGGGPRLASIVEKPVVGKDIRRHFLYGKDCNFEGVGYSRFPVTPESFCQRLDKHYFVYNNYGYADFQGKSVTYSNILNEQVDERVYYPCVAEEVNGVLTVHYSHYEDVDPRFPLDAIDVHDKLAVEDSCAHYKRILTKPLETTHSVPGLNYTTVRDIKPLATFENYCGTSLPEHYQRLYGYGYNIRHIDVVQRESDMTSFVHKYHDEEGGTLLQETESRTYSHPGIVSRITTDQEQVVIKYSGMESPTGVYWTMQQKNVLSVPTETKHYVNGTLRKQIDYHYDINPDTNSGYSLSSVKESVDTHGQMRTVETYSSYLPCGKPCQITKVDGRNIAIVWSYGGKYPIAIAEGLQASDLIATGINLKSVAVAHSVDEFVYMLLDELRAQYPNARINTYRYHPEMGMIQKTSSDGVSEHYSYDPNGRLEEVKDNQLQTILKYEYHETNQ